MERSLRTAADRLVKAALLVGLLFAPLGCSNTTDCPTDDYDAGTSPPDAGQAPMDGGASEDGGSDAGGALREDGEVPSDAGFDAATPLPDAGIAFDSGIMNDSGIGDDAHVPVDMDAFVPLDAGVPPVDAWVGTDAWVGIDSGIPMLPDAGSDAGADAGRDAGPPPPPDAGVDAGPPDAGVAVDAGAPDAGGPSGPPGTVAINGLVLSELAHDHVAGALVFLRTLDGLELGRATTDASGRYRLRGPQNALAFLEVAPQGAYLGVLRAEQLHDVDYDTYELTMPARSGVLATAAAVGVPYDSTRGVIAVGITPVTTDRGGEGAALGPEADAAPPANLTATGVILSNVLLPRCGPSMPMPCTTEDRSNQIHFLNTLPGLVTVSPISPSSGTCGIRFPVAQWLVRPDTYTSIDIDCH